MENQQTLQEVLERHIAFWECADVDRPLLWTTTAADWKPFPPYRLRDGRLAGDNMEVHPGMIDLEAVLRTAAVEALPPSSRARDFMRNAEKAVSDNSELNVTDGDLVISWGPHGFPFMEAILGCPIFHQNGSCWTQPFAGNWRQINATQSWRDSPWLEETLAANQWLVDATQGRMGVAQPLFRGPFDMAIAAVGAVDLCTLAADGSPELVDLMDCCTNLYIDVAQRRLAETPPFHGGYFPTVAWGVWAPGPTVRFQSDSSYMVSPRMYREHFLPHDRRVAQAFEYSAIGTHTSQANHLPVYAEIPELRLVKVVLEAAPFGRPPLELLPQFHAVQDKGKALLLMGIATQSELDRLLTELSPRGLALRIWLRDDQ